MSIHRTKAALVLFLLIMFAATTLSLVNTKSHEPRNLALCKQEVKEYVTSEQYMEDISKVTSEAEQYIGEHLDSSRQNAIVLDIDETSLSHLQYELSLDFGYSSSTWQEWIKKAQASPILPTLSLYNWARSKNLATFFVTGTTEDLRTSLTTNLAQAGYMSWDSLYMRPEKDHEPASVYKSKVRKEITEKGYYIIANIGDQESDFAGGYAEKAFKLPNPMYMVK